MLRYSVFKYSKCLISSGAYVCIFIFYSRHGTFITCYITYINESYVMEPFETSFTPPNAFKFQVLYSSSSSIFIDELTFFEWMYHSLIINSLTEVYLGYFQFGTIVNSADMNIHVHVEMKKYLLRKEQLRERKDKPWASRIYLKITLYSEYRKLILELYQKGFREIDW